MSNDEYKKFVRKVRNFFVDDNGRLYRRNAEGAHKLVVEKDKQMSLMKAAHDNLGHRGFYATKSLIAERFYWPEMERDVSWYCKTCQICQGKRNY